MLPPRSTSAAALPNGQRSPRGIALLNRRNLTWPLSLALVGLVTSFVQTPLYESRATLLFPREAGVVSGMSGLSGLLSRAADGDANELMTLGLRLGRTPSSAYANAVFKGRVAAEQVVERCHLDKLWPASSHNDLVLALRARIRVVPRPLFGALDVSMRAPSAQQAHDILAAYIDAYRNYSARANLTSAKRLRVFLDSQVKLHQGRLAEAEQALVAFQSSHDAAWLNDEAGGHMAEQILSAESAASIELQMAEARAGAVQQGIERSTRAMQADVSFPPPTQDAAFEGLQYELTRARLKRDQLAISRTSENLELKAADLQVRTVEKQLAERLATLNKATSQALTRTQLEVSTNLTTAQARARAAHEQAQKQLTRLKGLSVPRMQLFELKRRFQTEETLTRLLNLELQKAMTQENLDSVDLEVLDPPDVPIRPVLPRKGLYTILGFLLGWGVVFLRWLATSHAKSNAAAAGPQNDRAGSTT